MDQNEPQMKKKIKLNNSSEKEAINQGSKEHQKPTFIEAIKKDLQFLIKHKVQDSKLKQTRAAQVYQKIQGIIFQIAHSRVGGRVVQLIVKCSDEKLRNKIFSQLLENEQQFSEILKSKYAHFVGITMIRNIPNKFKNQFFQHLYKEAFQYIAHKEAGLVLNRFLLKCASPHQLNLIKALFTDKSKKEDNNQTIENLAIKIIEKEMHKQILSLHVLNLAMPRLIPVEQEKVLSYFTSLENHDYLHLKEGAQVKLQENNSTQFYQFFCSLINASDTKNRKLILRNISQTFPNVLVDKNDYYHMALIKLLHSIDDTKILNKLISTKLIEHLSELIQAKKGQSILFSLFIPQHNELTSFEKSQSFFINFQQKSKKDTSVRLREVKEFLSQALIQELVNNISDELLIKDFSFSRFTCSVIRFLIEEEKQELAIQLLTRVKGLLVNVEGKAIYDPKEENNYWILTHPDAQRVAKCLILSSMKQQDYSRYNPLQFQTQNEISEFLTDFYQQLTNILLKRIKQCLHSKAIFLLIALMENTNFKEEISYKQKIILSIKKQKINPEEYKEVKGFNIFWNLIVN